MLTPAPTYPTIPFQYEMEGGMCMIGGIYSDQKCEICCNNFKHIEKTGLFCPNHPNQSPTRYKVIFKTITKRFDNYPSAYRFLTGLRYKYDEGSFDERDYRKDQPLGFENLALKWLSYRKDVRCFRNLKNHIGYACEYFRNKSIKEIGYAELEDFFGQLPNHLSGKSRYNIRTTLHSFWVWLRKRRILRLDQIPEFPEIKFELGWRNTIPKDTQESILDEIYRISYKINPKIWVGINWLITYVNLRPIELINIKEGDFDVSLGIVNVRYNKEKKPKIVKLLDEDVDIIKSFPPGLPHLYFFRHGKRKGVHADKRGRFGKDYLYKWWKQACGNLGIDGVDLYGGTRHSSVRALREYFSPEEIRQYGTTHSTNKAFERYFKHELSDQEKIFKKSKVGKKKGEVLHLELTKI